MKTNNLVTAILILKGDPVSGELVFNRSYEYCAASLNERVAWIIYPDSGVGSIIAITTKRTANKTTKEDDTNIFSEHPSQLKGSEFWEGRIRNDLTEPTEEDYNIIWKDTAGKKHIFDPKIMVNV